MRLLKRSKKGQIAMEYLAVFSITLLMTLPMVVIFLNQSNSLEMEVVKAQIGRATNEIADAAEEVSYMGLPAKKTIRITVPANIEDINISDRLIKVTFSTQGQKIEMTKETAVNITGDISEYEGQHTLQIIAQENNVLIEEK